MKRMFFLAVAFLLAAVSTGCATITTGQNQSLSVETRHEGTAVAGAACKLSNDKGTWFVTTPGSVIVNRAYGDLAVNCTHEKYLPGVAVVKSSTKAMAFGNILVGGVIGAAVDVGTGSAYDYPPLISIDLGLAQGLLAPQPKPAGAE
ncbi:MAG TPA: hypothetical protein VFJ62_08955 [Usitatibacter sp.]|nr:hypothetical protein [Usitatibacter sp.]